MPTAPRRLGGEFLVGSPSILSSDSARGRTIANGHPGPSGRSRATRSHPSTARNGHDLISLGFISSPQHSALIDNSKPISQLEVNDYDAILFVGGEGPMYTFYDNDRVHKLAAQFYKTGKITAVVCHATCLLLKAKVDGALLVKGKTWTGFANSEEKYADGFIGKRMQPFWIEEEAKKIPDTNFIVSGRFKAHAVRDGNLITGQQQYSALAAARLVIEALGV